MEFVRKVINSEELEGLVEIPKSLINRKVEILIFPIDEISKKKAKKKSMSGFLAEYANPKLIDKEENIWMKEAKE